MDKRVGPLRGRCSGRRLRTHQQQIVVGYENKAQTDLTGSVPTVMEGRRAALEDCRGVARALRISEGLESRSGSPRESVDEQSVEPTRRQARSELGAEEYERFHSVGYQLGLEEAIARWKRSSPRSRNSFLGAVRCLGDSSLDLGLGLGSRQAVRGAASAHGGLIGGPTPPRDGLGITAHGIHEGHYPVTCCGNRLASAGSTPGRRARSGCGSRNQRVRRHDPPTDPSTAAACLPAGCGPRVRNPWAYGRCWK